MGREAVSSKPVEIFISYSRKDQRFLEELRAHLKIGESSGRIHVWHDGNLAPGVEWEQEIYAHFCSAQIILLLVSADFFASEYCVKRELPAALQRHQDAGVTVVPVIVRPCDWQRTQLADLQALPKNSKAIDLWEHKDEAYDDIARSLAKLVDTLPGPAPSAGTPGDPWSSRGDGAAGEARADVTRPAAAAHPVDAKTPEQVVPAPVVGFADGRPAQSELDQRRVGIRASLPEIVVCFLHAERQEKLLRLRKWCYAPNDRLFDSPAARIAVAPTLREAIERLWQRPEATILLLDGFEPACP